MGNDESSLKENQEFREKLITIKYPNGDVYQGKKNQQNFFDC